MRADCFGKEREKVASQWSHKVTYSCRLLWKRKGKGGRAMVTQSEIIVKIALKKKGQKVVVTQINIIILADCFGKGKGKSGWTAVTRIDIRDPL